MKRLCTCIVLTAVLCATVSALEWPADSQQFVRFFGQCIDRNTFEQGLVFKNAEAVRTADNGILLIALDKKYKTGSFPSTLGNALIFLHADGLQTVYGNLDETELLNNRTTSEARTIIGKTGCSGWAQQYELIFQVRDNQKNVYINPLLLLPHIDDTAAPKIYDIILIDEKKEAFPMSGQKKIRQGRYELYAHIFDTITNDSSILSPFRITIFLNGANIRTIPFETIAKKNGDVYLGSTAFTDALLYQRTERLYLGNIVLSRGKSDILITARDITGNEKSEQFTVQVD